MIRTAIYEDKEKIKKLWNYCFYDSDPFLSWWFDNIYGCENTVVAEENGEIAGALQLISYTLSLDGKAYDAFYVCGVSVAPRFRGRGIGGKMLEFAEGLARERNKVFLLLISDADGFYEKYGYYPCFDRVSYHYKPQTPYKAPGNVKKAELADAAELLRIYNEYTGLFDGYIRRGAYEAEKIIEQYSLYHGGVYIVQDGYLVFSIENRILTADEIAYTSRTGLENILGFIYSHGSQIDKAIIKTAGDDPIQFLLYGKQVERKNLPSVMAKSISDVDLRVLSGQITEKTAEFFGIKQKADVRKNNFINII